MRTKNENTMQEIIDFINARFFADRTVPSIQEIADEVGLNKSNVSRYLTAMEEKGMISRNGSYYGLETNSMKKVSRNLQQLPIVGDIACGTPILAEQNIESYLTISGNFLGAGNYFVLKAKGESMINVGIYEGDWIVVEKRNTARNGEIIVALVDDSATVKTFYKEDGHIRLQPENDTMDPIIVPDCKILGKVISLYRRFV